MKSYKHYHYKYTNDFFFFFLPLISAENKAHHCANQALISQSFFSEYSQMTCSFDFSSVERLKTVRMRHQSRPVWTQHTLLFFLAGPVCKIDLLQSADTKRESALAGWAFLSACQFYLLFICPLIQSDLHYATCLPWSGVTLTPGTMRFTPPMSDAQVMRLQKGGRQPTGTQSPPEQRG